MPNLYDCLPDREFSDVVEAFEFLLDRDEDAYAGVLVDVDGVLVEVESKYTTPVVGENVDSETIELLEAVDERFGARIVTNHIKQDDFDPDSLESVFDVPVVTGVAPKPSEEIFHAAVRDLGVSLDRRSDVVMVGDSTYYDTYGAGRAGLTTFQVDQDRTEYPLPQMLGKTTADSVQATVKLARRFLR